MIKVGVLNVQRCKTFGIADEDDQTIITKAGMDTNKYIILRNKPENGGVPDKYKEWVEIKNNQGVSMSANHQFLAVKNKYWNLFDDKLNQYNYLYRLLPRLKFKKIAYIKKTKKDKEIKEEKQLIPEFFSQREYKQNKELSDFLNN